MPESQNFRRKFERLQYPMDHRPCLVICGIPYKIHDISRGGVNIIAPQTAALILHQDVSAQFILNDEITQPFSGTLSILPPRYTLVFSHHFSFDNDQDRRKYAAVGLEVNGFTFQSVNPNNKNIPLYVNEVEINTFSKMLPPVQAKLIFQDREELPVCGTIVRVKQRGTAMKFLEELSPERMEKENLFIKSCLQEPEIRYGNQLRVKVPKNQASHGADQDDF